MRFSFARNIRSSDCVVCGWMTCVGDESGLFFVTHYRAFQVA